MTARSRYPWLPRPLKPYLRAARAALRAGRRHVIVGTAGRLRRPCRWPAEAPSRRTHPAPLYAVDPIADVVTGSRGAVLLVSGWCFHPEARVVRLNVVLNGTAYPVQAHGMPRLDVMQAFGDSAASAELAFYSGFWALVPLRPVTRPATVQVSLRIGLAGGTVDTGVAAAFTCYPQPPDVPPPVTLDAPAHAAAPLVAICMATYNPPIELFERQVRSLQAQTLSNWICIVSDDVSRPEIYAEIQRITGDDCRFWVTRNAANLGFYHNFEGCLRCVPEHVPYVALADQDDYWYPHKLATLVASCRDDVTLAYSDMRIVTADGETIAVTFWRNRRNNYDDLVTLIIGNTVTGAAALFRRDLLEYVLPFPQRLGHVFHDHWIACVALAMGRIAYVDRPLYDYVQHRRNVVGAAFEPQPLLRSFVRQLREILAVAGRSVGLAGVSARDAGGMVSAWRAIYFHSTLHRELYAQTLLLRCGKRLHRRKRAALHHLARLDAAPRHALWLAALSARHLCGGGSGLGEDIELLKSVLWKHVAPTTDIYVQPLHETGLYEAEPPAGP